MAQTDEKNKFYISPTDREDLLAAIIKAQAVEESNHTKQKALGKKYKRKLEAVDVLVMFALIGHRNNKTGQCNPSQPTIAAELGRSTSTVQRSMSRIKKSGFMEVIQKFNGSEQLASQCNIHFERGRPWLEKSSQDDTPQSQVTGGPVTGDRGVQSRVTDELSEVNPVKEPSESKIIPDRSAPGMRARFEDDSASGAGRHDLSGRPHKQTSDEAKQAYHQLKSLPWGTEWDDPIYQSSARAGQGALVHWYRHLRKGLAANRIVQSAELFLRECPDTIPSLAGYLAHYAGDCADPDSIYYVPDDAEKSASNDNHEAPERKVSDEPALNDNFDGIGIAF